MHVCRFHLLKVQQRVGAPGPLVCHTYLYYDLDVAVFVAVQYFTETTSRLDNWIAN